MLISFHIVALLSRFKCFSEKPLHWNSRFQYFLRLSLTIPIKDLIFFTQIFASKVKPSQTWCFAILKKSCLTYDRVKTIFKKAARDRRFTWLGVNPDLSRLQKKCVSKKSVYSLYVTGIVNANIYNINHVPHPLQKLIVNVAVPHSHHYGWRRRKTCSIGFCRG